MAQKQAFKPQSRSTPERSERIILNFFIIVGRIFRVCQMLLPESQERALRRGQIVERSLLNNLAAAYQAYPIEARQQMQAAHRGYRL